MPFLIGNLTFTVPQHLLSKIRVIFNGLPIWRQIVEYPGGVKKSNHILVADDDPLLLELTHSSLTSAGYQVTRATNGVEAAALLDQTEFDLIISDLDMPQMDGFGLLEAVRNSRLCRHVPTIVITTHDEFEAIERAYALGATSFMIKPLNWTQFGHHVRYILRASRHEAELRKACDAAEAASQLKSDVLSVVTHEFRTPLHQIIGFSDLLERHEGDVDAASKRQDFSNHIRDAAVNLDRMVSDMLIFSRLLAEKPSLAEQDLSVQQLISLATKAVETLAAEKNVEIVDRASENADVDLVCDRAVFERAFTHLMENAIEHTPEGGMVVVGANMARGGQLVCFVKDDGPGIEQARVEELLDPLSQGDMSLTRSGSGLGIGLSIARLAAEAHGGQFLLETAPGAGTTAALVFPSQRVGYSDPQWSMTAS